MCIRSKSLSKFVRSAVVLLVVLAVYGGAASIPSASYAADFPTKSIELVYHTAAGGGGDIFLRTFSKAAEKALGQTVVVSNIVGGSGFNAWNYVNRAKNDGYTILGISPAFVSNAVINNMPLSYKDFEPIAIYFTDPIVYYVKNDSSFNTMQDVIDYAKAHPGELKVAGGTSGAAYHLAHMEFINVSKLDMPIVPYEGGGEQVAAILGGHLPLALGNYTDIVSNVEAGTIRVISTFNKMPAFPDIPDMNELGYPDANMEMFRGLAAPKGTDPEVVKFLGEAYKTAYEDPEFKAYMEANFMLPAYKTGADAIAVFESLEQQTKDAMAASQN